MLMQMAANINDTSTFNGGNDCMQTKDDLVHSNSDTAFQYLVFPWKRIGTLIV